MSKPIKSSARSLLYTMISKYEQRKDDINQRFEEKERFYDEIISAASLSDDEDFKRQIEDLVKELKDVEKKDLITSESSYLAHLSKVTVGVNTMRRIKKGRFFKPRCVEHARKKTPSPDILKDRITEEELEPFLIHDRDDESDSDESFEGIEFLESDFDYGSE